MILTNSEFFSLTELSKLMLRILKNHLHDKDWYNLKNGFTLTFRLKYGDKKSLIRNQSKTRPSDGSKWTRMGV